MSVDIFANPSGNYNGAIVGTSGSGKSFLVNEIVRRTLGTGGRAWIIDVGQSYKKSCTLLGGQYIEIGVEEDPTERITFNPFLLINDIDEDMEMIKPLVARRWFRHRSHWMTTKHPSWSSTFAASGMTTSVLA